MQFKYLAFLRGINVGGNHKVPMAELKKILAKLGFENVKTLIASGNVAFESSESNPAKLRLTIEKALQKMFGFEIPTIVRTADQLAALIKADPFKKIKVTSLTRSYVTFLGDKPPKELKKSYVSEGKEFRILEVTDGEIFSVLELSPTNRTVDSMNYIQKKFGKNITTRNWNTVQKMAAL